VSGEIGPSVYNQIVKENVTGNVKTKVVLSVFMRDKVVGSVKVQFMFLNSRFKVTLFFYISIVLRSGANRGCPY
jgi:hypothetical protein